MSLRLIEIVAPDDKKEAVIEGIKENRGDKAVLLWSSALEDDHVSIRVLVDLGESEDVLDHVSQLFKWDENYRLVIYPVQATLPRFREPEEDDDDGEKEENGEPADAEDDDGEEEKEEETRNRASREELYTSALDSARLTTSYLVMIALSSVVAAIGIVKNNTAIIIGAMVIAPLLGPNIGLSLASTLGDSGLAKESVKSALSGLAIAIVVSLLTGFFFQIDLEASELVSRTSVALSDVVLALVAGAAGMISFTQGLSTVLVGVMVALSLMPPLAVFGLLLGAGHYSLAVNAGLLVLINLISLNLAGVVIFLLQGIRPSTWVEQEKARKSSLQAVAVWLVLLAALIVAIYLMNRKGG